MTDSMNFGPEWLRNLSSDGSTSGGSTSGGGVSRPQLADYRYGREEMLTLFTKGLRPPSSLTNYPMLYANTAQGQLPLALTPVTEDERGGSGGNLGGGWTLGSGSRGGGASISSVSGRGAGGAGRSISLVNSGGRGGGMGSRGGGRGGVSGGGGWTAMSHNGSSVEAPEWSPRKEYIGGGSGGGSYRSQSLLTDNWRKGARPEVAMDGDGSAAVLLQQQQQQQQQDGWRQGQQIRGEREQRWIRSTSWRDGDSTAAASSSTTANASVSASHQHSRGPQQRRVWDEDQQQLPEWALEQASEPGGATPVAGTFDASGAFHGDNSARMSTSNVLHKSTSQQNIAAGSKTTVPLTTSRSAISLVKGSGQQSATGNIGSNAAQISPSGNVNKDHQPDTSNDKRLPDNAIKEKNRPTAEQNSAQHQTIDKRTPAQQLINGSVNGAALNKEDAFENSSSVKDSGIDRDDEDFDRLQEDLVLKLVVDEEPTSNNSLGVRGARVGGGTVNHALTPPPPPNLVLPAADKWFYQDPQGDLQGPFIARDMAEWYRAGYFSVALLVRRGCDERFFRLGDLVTLCQGCNPFQASPLVRQPPPLLLRDRDQLQQREQQQQQREVPVIGAPVAPVNGSAVTATVGPAPMLPDHPDLLQLQILQQQIAYRQHTAAQHQQQQYNNPAVLQSNHQGSIVDTPPAPWASLSALQERELLTQQLLQSQSHPHIHQQPPQAQSTNPLMHMISQMQQQSSKGAVPIMEQQVPVQAIPTPLPPQQQPPSQPPTTQSLNPLEALIAQMGNLQQTAAPQPPLHASETTQPPSQQPAASSNPLLELLRMKQHQHPVHQSSIPPTTQLEQLAMWQKNHQYSAASANLLQQQQQHLQHVQQQQQQQQWRTLQQPQTLQDPSVGLWDVSTSIAQTTTSQIAPSTIGSVIHQQQQLSHHLSPSPPMQQLPQQLVPQLVTSPQHKPTTLPGHLPLETHLPISAPQISREQQQPVSLSTTGKKKKPSTEIITSTVDKSASKKDDEKQKKKDQNKKQDVEKKQLITVVDEKRKKEEDKAARNKEEKAKQRELEERKAKEQEQKRKSKEQRKLDEENRRKAEEKKRLEEIERERQAARDRDEQLRRQQQQLHLAQMQQEAQQQPSVLPPAPPVPWLLSGSNSVCGNRTIQTASTVSPPPATNLAEIQRAEREKRASEQQQQQQMALVAAAALYQQQHMQMQLDQQQADTKTSFSWASKPLKPDKVKSLAEIQAEEQELFLKKQVEEQRLAAIKEKEAAAVPTAGIWSGQSLTWSTENATANNIGGFWDESPRSQKQQISTQQVGSKALSCSNVPQTAKQTPSTVKPLTAGNQIGISKKIQQPVRKDITTGKNNNNNNNNDSSDEFSNWCSKMLANMNANVDVPTFIGFLRDIESAFDVREYCRDYLGDSNATQQFASQFVEKRRLFKPNRSVTHKDDMCAPAPALTPNHHAGSVATITATVAATANIASTVSYNNLRDSSIGNNLISTDFQEVKAKGKKVKKSKMLKVDSRILGFSVTAAPDRFNVGDRDYGDTT